MAQIQVWRQFLEKLEPHNKPVWDLIPKTYKSLQRMADSTQGVLSDCARTISIFDICLDCGKCVFDESKEHLTACDVAACAEPRTSKSQILVVDIVRRFQRLMKHKDYAKAFRYGYFIS
jgi:hypothetical protein